MRIDLIRTLHCWPLSRVDLVSVDGRRMVLKVIHSDFAAEVDRQKAVRNCARSFSIPEIYAIFEREGRTCFLMEYVDGQHVCNPSHAQVLLENLREETAELLPCGPFLSYTRETLAHDIGIASVYGQIPPVVITPGWFDVIFGECTIVHGDWKFAQLMVGSGRRWILDFGRSFIGPPLLDEAHFIRTEKPDWMHSVSSDLAKAIVADSLRNICWFHLCRTRYVSYSYENEIQQLFVSVNDAVAVAAR